MHDTTCTPSRLPLVLFTQEKKHFRFPLLLRFGQIDMAAEIADISSFVFFSLNQLPLDFSICTFASLSSDSLQPCFSPIDNLLLFLRHYIKHDFCNSLPPPFLVFLVCVFPFLLFFLLQVIWDLLKNWLGNIYWGFKTQKS